MSENGIALFRVSPDDGDQDRDVPFLVSPSPVDGRNPTGILPDKIDENENDKTNGRPPTPRSFSSILTTPYFGPLWLGTFLVRIHGGKIFIIKGFKRQFIYMPFSQVVFEKLTQ